MPEKGHESSLIIISVKSFCSTTHFIFSVSFIAKLVVNKLGDLKLRKENIEKEHQVAQFLSCMRPFFHRVLLLRVQIDEKDNIGLKLYKHPKLFIPHFFRFLQISLSPLVISQAPYTLSLL